MADIELVIKIDEEDYKIMKHNIAINNPLCPLSQEEMVVKVANGTRLPKNHGRLGDLDRVKAKVFNASMDEHFMPINLLTCDDVTDIIDYIPTIIERSESE